MCAAGARDSRASVRARSTMARRALPLQPPGGHRQRAAGCARSRAARPPRRRASAWSTRRRRRRRAACGRCGGRPRRSTGTRSSATVRHSVSSQNANRSASEPPPRATTIASTSAQAARSWSARVIAGAAWRSWTGANAHTTRPRQPRRSSAGQQVVARLAVLAAHHADRAREGRPVELLLVREQPFAVKRPAQLLELRQQVALAGDPEPRHGEREGGGGRARAGVVVAAAGRHDLHAVGQRAEPERVEVGPPHRARQRARAVAQLEPHLRAAGLEGDHLAEHLHAREAAQLVAQRGCIVADRPRAGERGAGDSGGARGLWHGALRTLWAAAAGSRPRREFGRGCSGGTRKHHRRSSHVART